MSCIPSTVFGEVLTKCIPSIFKREGGKVPNHQKLFGQWVSDKYRSEVTLKIDTVKDRFLPFQVKKLYKEAKKLFSMIYCLKTKISML